jgi:hypothetical protein
VLDINASTVTKNQRIRILPDNSMSAVRTGTGKKWIFIHNYPPAPAYHHRSGETMECNGLQDGKSGKNKGIPGISGNATGIPDTLLLFPLKDPVTG